MTTTPTNAEKLRKLPWSVATDATSSIYAQLIFFGSIFVLFLDALEFSKSQIGFLLSLITFFGLIALFVASPVARFGYKRTFVAFWGLRKFATIFLLFTPWILIQFGNRITFYYIAGVIVFFAFARAVAITAYYPWVQEFVPNAVRGKYTAIDNIFASLVGLMAIIGAGYVIERTTGLNGFMILFAIGIFFGALSVWTATRIPGGAPVEPAGIESPAHNLLEPIRDQDFVRYLVGASAIYLATVPLASFLPLFMQEQVGLSSGQTVWLQTGTMLGGLLSTFFWGWTADRYGSKPITLSGIILLILLPICWILMPRHSASSLVIALGIAFLQGIANMGWAIGAGRLLFVGLVPADKKTGYMAVYYAVIDVVSGLSKILGGQIVQWSAAITGQFLIFTLDPYLIVFLIALVFPFFSLYLLRQIHADEEVSLGQFAGLFVRGNALMAMHSLIRYHFAKDEVATVAVTEHLGQAKSGLAVKELLDSLEDPRFYVRFEAINAIAHTKPDARLTHALIEVFKGTELALTAVAAAALGRIGDPAAIEPLRAGLHSSYRSIRAHSARALGALGDVETIPLLLERLKVEEDKGLQMAYASALGQLKAAEASTDLLRVLKATRNRGARMELALALARLAGEENRFIRLLRQVRADPGTATSQMVLSLVKKTPRNHPDRETIRLLLTNCADILAQGNLDQGARLVSQIINRFLNDKRPNPTEFIILQECAACLDEFEAGRLEYLLLALHTLAVLKDETFI